MDEEPSVSEKENFKQCKKSKQLSSDDEDFSEEGDDSKDSDFE